MNVTYTALLWWLIWFMAFVIGRQTPLVIFYPACVGALTTAILIASKEWIEQDKRTGDLS